MYDIAVTQSAMVGLRQSTNPRDGHSAWDALYNSTSLMVQLLESKHHQAIYHFAGHVSIIPNERHTGEEISFTRNEYDV